MKLVVTALLLTAASVVACAQMSCCASSGTNYAILPNVNQNVLGLRYSYRSYNSKTHVMHESHHMTLPVREQLNSLQIFGRFNVAKHLQLSVSIPVDFIEQHAESFNHKTAGFGDIRLLLHYNLLDKENCSRKKTKHKLQIGAGTKLPSGAFKMHESDQMTTNLQPGTGSIDFMANAIYIFRFVNFGFSTNAFYQLNTTNPQGYRFGDKVQTGISFFYVVNTTKSIQFMPSVGFNYIHQLSNSYMKSQLSGTSGYFLTASAGFDVYYKQFAFSSSFSPALMNSPDGLGGNKNKFNFEAGVFYNFSITKNNNKCESCDHCIKQ